MLMAGALFFAPFVHAAEWNHDPNSAIGPTHWGELDPAYKTCVEGTRQSPVNIQGALTEGQPALVFHYADTPLLVENNGHTIEVPYELGSEIRIGEDTYRLLQYHFHAPSEHTIGDESKAMEVHMVHINSFGQLAVVGVTMEIGAPNPVVAATFDNAPIEEGETHVEGAFVNASGMLPRFRGYTTYTGSLTTPPCTEGVRWFVMKDPITVSQHQVDQMHDFIADFLTYFGYPNNNRPVQPLNGRVLSEHPGH